MRQRRSILVLSSLFPRPRNPLIGIFNYQAVCALASLADVTLMSPVSWIDRARERLFARNTAAFNHGVRAAAAKQGGFNPRYPVYFNIPAVGRGLNGYAQYRSILPQAVDACTRAPFDAILCYWVYPDGRAAALLSRKLGIPYALVALGSDLNIMGHSYQTRMLIRRTLQGARRVITVSNALRAEAVSLGAPPERVRVVANGVNPAIFSMRSRRECRERLRIGGDERLVLFIGSMHPVKGVDILLDALASLGGDRPGAILIGAGRHRKAYERRAARLGLGQSVRFTGQVPHEETAWYLNAADFLVLPSRFEGCPNVVLEALSCGTPVIASAVGGIPELITNKDQGILVRPDSPAELAQAIREGFLRSWPREEIARASTRTWDDVARETYEIIEQCIDDRLQ